MDILWRRSGSCSNRKTGKKSIHRENTTISKTWHSSTSRKVHIENHTLFSFLLMLFAQDPDQECKEMSSEENDFWEVPSSSVVNARMSLKSLHPILFSPRTLTWYVVRGLSFLRVKLLVLPEIVCSPPAPPPPLTSMMLLLLLHGLSDGLNSTWNEVMAELPV